MSNFVSQSRARSSSSLLRTTGVTALVLGLLAAPFAAVADTVKLDGDFSNVSNSKNTHFTLCQGVGSAVDVVATIDYTGNGGGVRHFADGGTVTITTSVPAAAAGFLEAGGGSVITTNWDSNSDSVSTDAMPLTVGAAWTAGTYKVTYTFSGTDDEGENYVQETTNVVVIQEKASGCDDGGGGGTVNTAPTVDVTGFTDGGPVEIGTVVTPGCSVIDAQDGSPTVTPTTSGPVGALSDYGLGVVTVTCSYTDTGGLSGSDQETYTIVDTGAPVITDQGATASADGSNGWYITSVTNNFLATDSGAGFPTATPKQLTKSWSVGSGSTEGPAVKINSGTATDVAGNVGAAIDSAAFRIDLSDPLLNVSDSNTVTAFDLCTNGTPVRPTYSPSDAISGLDGTEGDSWTTPSSGTGVGSYTYSAHAQDMAGRTASFSRSYSVSYGSAFGGVLQPVNSDGSSRFKLGSTVPVKFKLMCGTTPISGAVASLFVRKFDAVPNAGTDEAVSTASSTTGNLFRYDATAGQYIFNLNTKSSYTNRNGTTIAFAPGTYTLTIQLDDGTSRSVDFNLVK